MAKSQEACIKCGSGLESCLFCFSCSSIQPFPGEVNFFEILGLSVGFEVDENEIEKKYHNLSFVLHPDSLGSATKSEKILSEKASAVLNTAYNTLSKINSRASYLLSIFSKKIKLDERSLPEGFLSEIFILQERLEELLESEKKSELSDVKKNLMAKQKKIESVFALLFQKLEESPKEVRLLQELQTNLNAERYLFRLLERIN